jgi:CPA2 family monovalent cation:H+ antiporter-2
MILSESEYSHQALSDIVPLRDVFSMLFFVSVGMLINPTFVWYNALVIGVFVLVVMLSKATIFGVLSYLFKYRGDTPLAVGLGLFQVGEFAFVLARVGLDREMLSLDQYNILLATALVTMILTPSVMRLRPLLYRLQCRLWPAPVVQFNIVEDESALQQHAILVGYGRVGQYTAQLLQRLGLPFVIIEADQNRLESLQKQHLPVIYGDGASAEVLHAAHIERARMVLIAVGSAVDVESIARQARTVAPTVHIVARAAVINQVEVLHALGIHEVVQPEFEAGLEMMRQTLLHFGIPSSTIEQMSDEVRDAAYLPIRTATERVEG